MIYKDCITTWEVHGRIYNRSSISYSIFGIEKYASDTGHIPFSRKNKSQVKIAKNKMAKIQVG